MPKQSHGLEDDYYTQAQMDLLEALLDPDDAPYPWNTADPDSEAYFAEQEQNFLIEDWAEEDTNSQVFFDQLEQIWSTNTATADPSVNASSFLQANLPHSFAVCVPKGWMEAIAHQAHRVFSTPSSTAEQLVQCVQALLPNWAKEDLLVIARFVAYTRRGKETEPLEGVLGNVCSQDWTALSELERAKTSLVIALYVVSQLQHSR